MPTQNQSLLNKCGWLSQVDRFVKPPLQKPLLLPDTQPVTMDDKKEMGTRIKHEPPTKCFFNGAVRCNPKFISSFNALCRGQDAASEAHH